MDYSNGLETKDGEQLIKLNSKDWRDRLFENLPYKPDDCMLVNLPVKIDQQLVRYQMSSEKIAKILDDSQGNIYVFAGYLKPGKH